MFLLSLWLGNFSSLIQILVGFNFAFFASNSFLKELSKRLTGNGEAYEKLEIIEGQRQNQIQTIQLLINKYQSNDAALYSYGEILKSHSDLAKEKDKKFRELEDELSQETHTTKFRRFCFVGGIQGVIYLIISGLGLGLKDGFVEALILFNILFTLYLYIINFTIIEGRIQNIRNTIYGYGAFLIITFFLWIFCEQICAMKIDADLSTLYGISFVLICSSHFLYFFYYVWKKVNNDSQLNLNEIIEIQRKFDNIDIEMSAANKFSKGWSLRGEIEKDEGNV